MNRRSFLQACGGVAAGLLGLRIKPEPLIRLRLKPEFAALEEKPEVAAWLRECERRMGPLPPKYIWVQVPGEPPMFSVNVWGQWE